MNDPKGTRHWLVTPNKHEKPLDRIPPLENPVGSKDSLTRKPESRSRSDFLVECPIVRHFIQESIRHNGIILIICLPCFNRLVFTLFSFSLKKIDEDWFTKKFRYWIILQVVGVKVHQSPVHYGPIEGKEIVCGCHNSLDWLQSYLELLMQ